MFKEFLISLLAGIIITFFYERSRNLLHKILKENPNLIIKGRLYHHSIYGIISLFIYFITLNFIFLGLAFGIIIRHTWEERRFVFIEKI